MLYLKGLIKDAVADELSAIPVMIRVRVINH